MCSQKFINTLQEANVYLLGFWFCLFGVLFPPSTVAYMLHKGDDRWLTGLSAAPKNMEYFPNHTHTYYP